MKKRKLQRNKEEVIKRIKLGINQKANNTNSNNGSRPTLIQFLDYIFYEIYTMKVLVLKRFIPS